MMNTSIDYYVLQRLVGYIKGATNQGAFFPFEELVRRFKKTTQLSLGGSRQRKRYLAALKKLGTSAGIQFVMASGTRGKVLNVTSSNYTHFKHEYDREVTFAQVLLKALQKSSVGSIKVYDTLLGATALTKKSLERPVRILKNKAKRFGIVFYKLRRELYAKLKHPYLPKQYSKNSSKNNPQNYDITSNIVAKDKEILKNTSCEEVRFFNKDRIHAKAHWLSKRLRTKFYDNCKVKCCMPMLFKFTKNALQNGFEDKIIETKFSRALLVRHADATDMALNLGNPSFKFEMSSTVSLANQYLRAKEHKTVCERWNNLIEIIFQKRNESKNIIFKATETLSLSSEKAKFKSDESQVPYPAQGTYSINECLENNKRQHENHEEKMKALLVSSGYNNHDIQIFQSFQRGLMPNEQIQIYARKIVQMGIHLAERFSARSEYNGFR